MAKLFIETIKVNFKLNRVWELVFDDSYFHLQTYPYFETTTGF